MKVRLWTVMVALMFWGNAHAQDDPSAIQSVMEKVAPSIATVKLVIKTTMKIGGQTRDEESKMTIQGVVVTPDGLVMISNSPLSPQRMMEMLAGEAMPAGMDFKSTPTSIKVIFGNEDKEYDGFLAATDTKLDVAFVKVEGLGEKPLPPVDFGNAIDVKLGQRVISISRLSKGYDYAPYFALGQVCGEIAKPRRAWMLTGDISQVGLPVFTLDGQLVGVLTTVAPQVKEAEGDTMGFAMVMQMLSGGGMSASGGIFVVPGQQIKPLIEQANRRAIDLAAERAKKPKEAPKPSAPAGTAKPRSGGK